MVQTMTIPRAYNGIYDFEQSKIVLPSYVTKNNEYFKWKVTLKDWDNNREKSVLSPLFRVVKGSQVPDSVFIDNGDGPGSCTGVYFTNTDQMILFLCPNI
jgi:hypothetical protein